MNSLHRLYNRIPVRVRQEAGHVALTFVAAFVVVAAPAVPSVVHSPDLKTAKALIVATLAAAVVAGVRAAKPLVTRYITAATAGLLTHFHH